jgi:hypothetical protein
MTEYIVDSTGAGDFATLTVASKAAQPGDVFTVRRGLYRETLNVNTERTQWIAQDGALIDGGWRGGLAGTGWTPLIAVSAPGCTVVGFTAVNSYGRGIVIAASGTTVEDCHVENTFQGGLLVGDSAGPTISNVTVRDCVFTKMSQSWVTEKKPKNVNGSVNIHNVIDSIFERNVVSDGWGEGINLGRNSQRVIVRGNEVHSCNHVLAYINRAQDCVIEDNLLYHIPDPQYGGKKADSFSAAIVLGDEVSPVMAKFNFSRGNTVRENVVVGAGKLFQVRNNATADGYDTALVDTVIENNTFVAGPVTTTGIDIQSNRHKRPNSNSRFTSNAIEFTNAAAGADIGSYAATGVTFAGNAWSSPPPQSMQDASDVTGNLYLDDPAAPITRLDGCVTDIDIDNYRPLPLSPLVAGPTIGALDSIVVPEPEPGIDIDELLADAENAQAQIENALTALSDAGAAIDIIIAALNAAQL